MDAADIATQLIAMRAGATQQLAQYAMLKKSHQMDMALVDMIAQTARSAPPAGQGLLVDKHA